MRKIKTAVIGVGSLGQHHARVCSQLPQSELICVIDADGSQAKKIGEQWGVPHYSTHRDLPDSVEAVTIATPTIYHYEVARDLLARGIHLLVEKPMTATAQQARELVDLAKEKGCKLQVGHIERFNPAFMGIRQYIKKPLYMEATRMSPYSFRSIDVSVVLDLMIHDLDIVMSIAGSPVKEVEAYGIKVLSPQEDLARVRLKFENHCIADITANRVGLKKMRELRLFQQGSQVTLDFMNRRGRVFELSPDYSPEKIKGIDTQQDPSALQELVFSQFIKMEEFSWEGQEPLKEETGAFLDAIIEGKAVSVPGEDGLRAMEVTEAIFKSIEEHLNL